MNTSELLASITESQLPNRGVEIKFHKMSFPFLLHHVFSFGRENDGENFSLRLFSLLFYYMDRWMSLNQKNDSEKNRIALYDFQRSVYLNQIFHKVYDELNNSASITIPVSNARLVMKRFGECLGINLVSGNGNSEMHETGTPILESFCTGELQSCTYMGEFLHSIECVVPLPREDGINNSVVIDFNNVWMEFMDNIRCFDWLPVGHIVANVVELGYINQSQDDLYVGRSRKCKLPITCQINHYRGTELQKNQQWRKGSIESDENGQYRFSGGRDLCLSLKVSCPFPQEMSFMREVSAELEVGKIQNDLRSTGASIYAQLCTMMVDKYY